jgi:NAD(P)-dependent dehydrogenase (short-subunit alcohol dehydrogenase family)
MKEFQGRVAVITGAANGIGRALADRCAREGMKVVLAGINAINLARAEHELRASGATVLSVPADVSKADDVDALARKTLDAFGAVHLLFNNAGVETGAVTSVWENTLADWEWVIGVNLWGVIHGIRSFVPMMLQQGTEGHIVNTASVAGLISGQRLGIYKVTKHGVVSLSETLCFQLKQMNAKIGVSVLCPGWVKTRILDSARNRPFDLSNPTSDRRMSQEAEAAWKNMVHSVEEAITPQQVAERTVEAIRNDQFYILTDPHVWKPMIRKRMEDILQERNPT